MEEKGGRKGEYGSVGLDADEGHDVLAILRLGKP